MGWRVDEVWNEMRQDELVSLDGVAEDETAGNNGMGRNGRE